MRALFSGWLAGYLLIGAASVAAADGRLSWPAKTGPTFDGNAAEHDARNLPVKWDEATGENIAWKVPLRGQGHSTPVIGNGRIWFTAATEDGTHQFVYCIDQQTGDILHHKLLFSNENPEPLGNDLNTYASPSCVLEPDAVYVHFGSYGTARLDTRTADVVWQRRDIQCRHFRGPGSSPVIFENLLILTFDGIDQQFLMALDKQTGETVWRTDRTTDFHDLQPDGKPIRDGDFRKAFGTPGLIEVAGRTQVVSIGSRAAFGYDARTGKEIWTIRHEDYNAAVRPLFFNGWTILNTGSRTSDLIALRLDETTKGDVTDSHVVWMRSTGNPRIPYPVLFDEKLFMVTDNGVATCLDAKTGAELWKQRLGGNFVASPVIANGNVYFCNDRGVATVVKAGAKYELVSRNRLADEVRASPAVASGSLYFRGASALYKIGTSTRETSGL